jgi:glycosyltransferase involved in cell wall biosynthesis
VKVCILTHSFPPAQGAAERYISDLSQELRRLGIEVTVLAAAYDPDLPLEEEREGIRVYRSPVRAPPGFHNIGFLLQLLPRLKEVHGRERFDLLHSEHVFPVWQAGRFAKENRIPHLAVIEGISRVSLYSKFVCLTHRLVLPRAHYDLLVAWSRFLVEEFFQRWGLDDGRVRIVPGAVDTRFFYPREPPGDLRKRLSPDGKTILFTAKPLGKTNVLGLSYVLEAMVQVLREYPECRLIIGGDGRKKRDLEALARRLGIRDSVAFVGWISQERMPEYYAASDIVIDSITYRHAGSVTVLESLASGRPNVLTRIECLPGEESIPSEEVAVLVRPKDPEDMARGILELLQDPERGRRLGERGWRLVRDRFSMERVAREYQRLYEELLK